MNNSVSNDTHKSLKKVRSRKAKAEVEIILSCVLKEELKSLNLIRSGNGDLGPTWLVLLGGEKEGYNHRSLKSALLDYERTLISYTSGSKIYDYVLSYEDNVIINAQVRGSTHAYGPISRYQVISPQQTMKFSFIDKALTFAKVERRRVKRQTPPVVKKPLSPVLEDDSKLIFYAPYISVRYSKAKDAYYCNRA